MNAATRWLSGMGMGAATMYLLDPTHGNRRRALVADKLVRATRKTRDASAATARDVAHRTQGLAAGVRSRLRPQPVADDVLEKRVRARLGRVVSHPHSIQVSAREGRVTLRGAILAREVDQLLRAVGKVDGVREVNEQLEVHETGEGVPSLQGGAPRPGNTFELAQTNWSPAARLLVGSAGGALAAYGASRRSAVGSLLGASGAALLLRAATNLEAKRLIGLGGGRRAVDLQKTIHIDAPVEQVFEFWSNFQNFPAFMANVREVRPTAIKGQSHWTVAGPAGVPIEFDAIVTDFVPYRLLAWKTVEGAPVAHAGIVRFDPARGGTRVHIRMSYNPPAGAVGHAVASLIGADPKTKLDEDLVRMKTLVETGNRPHDAARSDRDPILSR